MTDFCPQCGAYWHKSCEPPRRRSYPSKEQDTIPDYWRFPRKPPREETWTV